MIELRFERARNCGLLVLPESGEGNLYTCIVDGIRAATGAINMQTRGQLIVLGCAAALLMALAGCRVQSTAVMSASTDEPPPALRASLPALSPAVPTPARGR